MTELLHEIGQLFLRAVPVALIVLLFYFIMRTLFFRPLLRVMAEREARTLGAQKAAESAQAAAAEKMKQYEEALRNAKTKVYVEQDAERKKLLDERAAFLKQERAKSATEVSAAKESVAGEFASAKKEIETTTVQLATEIARRVLQTSPGPASPAGEAR
jgi:F-type H+-transporting ATPase subunit b